MKMIAVLFVAVLGTALASNASAKQSDDEPLIRGEVVGGLGLIDDLRVVGESASSSYSSTTVNGVRTIHATNSQHKIQIVEDPASGITCKVTKMYGPDDLAKIESEQPELFMHLSSIPKTIGESEVEINVGVTTTYTAADAAELKEKNPEIFELYEKYTRDDVDTGIRMRMTRPLRFRFDPAVPAPRFRADDEDDDDDDSVQEDDDEQNEGDNEDDGDKEEEDDDGG